MCRAHQDNARHILQYVYYSIDKRGVVLSSPPIGTSLTSGRSSVTIDILHDVVAKNNVTIDDQADKDAFLLFLQSADATAASVDRLPDYIDPRLSPVPVVGERKYWKAEKNKLNAWSHCTQLVAAKPKNSLLKGRKIAIKDNMSVAGVPYTCGTFPQLASRNGKYPLSSIDATVVRRILEAGATISGTSTCENYSMTPLSYTSANGVVHNPWLPGYNTGGSSSGSACLLSLNVAREQGVSGLDEAGDGVDIAMGGDQAGSIRLPASYTGIYGLKPTHGLIPYTGIAPLHPMIDHCGPMANNLEDLAVMLSVLAGYDGLDARMTPESPLRGNVRDYPAELASIPSRSLKIGLITEAFSSSITSSRICSIVRSAAAEHFTAAGSSVSDVSILLHSLGPAIWTAATRTHMAGLAVGSRTPDVLTHGLPHFTPRWPLDQEMYDLLRVYNPGVLNVIFGETFLTEKYGLEVQGKAHRHVFELRAAYDKALEDFDVLITPTAPDVAPPHPAMGPNGSVMEKIKLAVGTTSQTCPFNVTGHPALSVPCGWADVEGGEGRLPVGMQIIGKRWDEIGVLRAAKVFERGGGGLGRRDSK